MKETLATIDRDTFDTAVDEELDTFVHGTTDRQDHLTRTEAKELPPVRRGFARAVLDKLRRKGPEIGSVRDNAFTSGIAERAVDDFGQVNEREMEVARAVRSHMVREETRDGRTENDRRTAIRQGLQDAETIPTDEHGFSIK